MFFKEYPAKVPYTVNKIELSDSELNLIYQSKLKIKNKYSVLLESKDTLDSGMDKFPAIIFKRIPKTYLNILDENKDKKNSKKDAHIYFY